MVLIAALALSLSLARSYLPRFFPSIPGIDEVTFGQWIGTSPWRAATRRWDLIIAILVMALGCSGLFTLCFTPAFLIVRLRRPRPPIRELVFQPGVVAFEVVLLGFVAHMIQEVIHWPPGFVMWIATNAAIPLAWGALALSGHWRPEPGWIDPSGEFWA